MSEFADDVAARLVSSGVGMLGTSIFISAKAVIPTGAGPYLSLTAYGGLEPERTQNAVTTPAYQRPSLQVTTRAASYPSAMTMARAAYNSLVSVRNQTLSGTYYREIIPIQEPFGTGLDGEGRPEVTFNVRGIKRP